MCFGDKRDGSGSRVVVPGTPDARAVKKQRRRENQLTKQRAQRAEQKAKSKKKFGW